MTLLRRGPHTISPTAHYTGYVWARHGIGGHEFATPEGRVLYNGLRPFMAVSRLMSGPTLEDFLLARHRLIDHLLAEAIESRRISQVLELAAGMSPRGHSFAKRFGARITYVETDLPGMVDRKRHALGRSRALHDPSGASHHRVEAVDVLRDHGPGSLSALVRQLDDDRGIAVITEGLLNYLAPTDVRGLWNRIAETCGGFPDGLYLSDLHLGGENAGVLERAFAKALGTVVRGQVHLHFTDAAEAAGALRSAGFDAAVLHRPVEFADQVPDMRAPGAQRVWVLAAHANSQARPG